MSGPLPSGLLRARSRHAARETMDRVVASVVARGINVFARIDHGAGAHAAGLTLRPTELLVFGTARAGTPLMQAAQTTGIDLPLKVLVWEDESGATWVGYNDPDWIAHRHGVAPGHAPSVDAIRTLLAAIAAEAAGTAEGGA